MGRPTGAHVCGPLQPLVRGFLLELIELGYSWTVQMQRLRLMAELSGWMAAQGVEANELTVSVIHDFLAPVRARGPKREWFSPTSERQLVDYLGRLGLVPGSRAAGGERSGRAAGQRVRRVSGAGARSERRFAHCLGVQANGAAVPGWSRRSGWWRCLTV